MNLWQLPRAAAAAAGPSRPPSRPAFPALKPALAAAAAAAVSFVSAPAPAGAADVVFYDQNLFDSQWTASYSGSYQSVASGRFAGGIGGSGFRLTEAVGFSFQSRVTYRAFHRWAAAQYNPAVSGAIDTISWDVWYQTLVGGHVLRLVAYQGDSVYWSPATEVASGQFPFWQRHVVTASPSSFVRVQGSGPAVLDFSASGSTIGLGYVCYNDAGLTRTAAPPQLHPSGSGVFGQFNTALYKVTVTPQAAAAAVVPEASSAALLGPAVLGAACGLRRRRARQRRSSRPLVRCTG